MYLINKLIKDYYWFALVLIIPFFGCDRSEKNFVEFELLPPVSDFIKPEGQIYMDFRQINQLDSAEPAKLVRWTWGADTIIDSSSFKQLFIHNFDLDILLPKSFIIEMEEYQIRRFVRNYRYPMFRLSKLNQWDSFRSIVKGVRPHYYVYWWKHELKKIEGQTPSQYKAYFGIDSMWFGELTGKSVSIEVINGIGINRIDLVELKIDGFLDTLRYYTLERIN